MWRLHAFAGWGLSAVFSTSVSWPEAGSPDAKGAAMMLCKAHRESGAGPARPHWAKEHAILKAQVKTVRLNMFVCILYIYIYYVCNIILDVYIYCTWWLHVYVLFLGQYITWPEVILFFVVHSQAFSIGNTVSIGWNHSQRPEKESKQIMFWGLLGSSHVQASLESMFFLWGEGCLCFFVVVCFVGFFCFFRRFDPQD